MGSVVIRLGERKIVVPFLREEIATSLFKASKP
jgi:hypothetical protein